MTFRMKGDFARLPRLWRYVYFTISSMKLTSFSAWVADGEPNPFVKRRPRPKVTTRPEIADIFEEHFPMR